MSNFPSIPDFGHENPEGMGTSVRSMKETLEIMTGQRRGETVGAPLMYVQAKAPERKSKNFHRVGDLWINTQTDVMSYWNGSDWKPIKSA